MPSSVTLTSRLPALRISTVTERAEASIAFSRSSLTTEAGRSTTSPAEISAVTSDGSRWMGRGLVWAAKIMRRF